MNRERMNGRSLRDATTPPPADGIGGSASTSAGIGGLANTSAGIGGSASNEAPEVPRA